MSSLSAFLLLLFCLALACILSLCFFSSPSSQQSKPKLHSCTVPKPRFGSQTAETLGGGLQDQHTCFRWWRSVGNKHSSTCGSSNNLITMILLENKSLSSLSTYYFSRNTTYWVSQFLCGIYFMLWSNKIMMQGSSLCYNGSTEQRIQDIRCHSYHYSSQRKEYEQIYNE